MHIDQAREIARAHARVLSSRIGEEVVIYDDPDRTAQGYLFYYNTPEAVAGKTIFGLAGNLPFLVAEDGTVEEDPGADQQPHQQRPEQLGGRR